ncbi:MAG: tRNA pseudouridine(38-40) synthase TruA [Methylococcales bacterium]|nr:tRNA pseudouridine(38-40) synthase TruA [Methylococcales bacterium]
MTRIVLAIEYDGSHFHGWQYQINTRTVQQVVEAALSKVANQPIRVFCTGRTDSGVHALAQIIHFDTETNRDLQAWLRGGNCFLPDDVRIIWVKEAVDDFHARYSAIARFYRYIILNRPMKSALIRQQATWFYEPLEADRMHLAAQTLVGHHDFSSFRAKGCQSTTPQRRMYFIHVYRKQDKIFIDLSANAFLHHMVRNIAGVLMEIGAEKQPIEWTQTLLTLKDREQGGITASPYGLYLAGVYYPERYGIPQHPIFSNLPKDAKRYY